ncbi:radical SAM protein [Candidatus Binatia bacterium]|nr:radical SAM protein [Candidatus Binatia bacterium]
MGNDASRRFQLILIKPSHYDDDGYVIQWGWSSVPSNTLATIYGLGRDCAQRAVLGDDVTIGVEAWDESNTRIRPERIARRVTAGGGKALVLLVGVQTNQFPRAVDIALRFVRAGLPVCIGGFHVSGCVTMLRETPPEMTEAMESGISLFAGELEGHLDGLLRDADRGRLEPLYRHEAELPGLEGQPVPYLPAEVIGRMSGQRASFDAGRGCPFLCSFCTIINVQGRKSRHRTADDVEKIVRENAAQGIRRFFITDDNFARNREWESILDRLAEIRHGSAIGLRITIQVDTMCHKIPNFIEKAGRAGVQRVFIGLENIHPESLSGSRKNQNKITEYRTMLQEWHRVGALTVAGYILGFPNDSRESILRDVRIIQEELPVDLLEFFVLTPLPGSQDHKEMHEAGVPLEPDMNLYDSAHVTAPHARMSADEWRRAYEDAWAAYYTPEHVARVMRRARQWGYSARKTRWLMFTFAFASQVEKMHPLESGMLRRKYRRDRRRGLSLESPLAFYARYAKETAVKAAGALRLLARYQLLYREVMRADVGDAGDDIAMQPVSDREMDEIGLFTVSDAARSAVAQSRKKSREKGVAVAS